MFKKLDFNVKESPFYNFSSSRYSISSKINVQFAWNYCKENDLSFFIVSLGCLLAGLNDVKELRRRIIDDTAIEFDTLDAITPIMNKDKSIFKEIRVSSFKEDESLKSWHDKVLKLKEDTLNGHVPDFSVDTMKRDIEPIANFSCIPWIDFDTMTNCIATPHQIQPLITWGKVYDGKMSVSISVNHIFVYGEHLGQFYNKIQRYFNGIENTF